MAAAAVENSPRRWWRFVRDRRVTCAAGHHIPATFDIPEHGFVRCSHWVGLEHRECGRWVFLFAIRGGRAVIAEVELREKDEMKRLTTPAEMLDYLEIFQPDIPA
jgi:hypothetical protein